MLYELLADGVLLLHLCFILFVLFGGLLVAKWPRLLWLHLPAVAWGVWIEWGHGLCPLTPLENYLRQQAGETGYQSGFIEHYIGGLVYPSGVVAGIQFYLGLLLIVLNLVIYGAILWRQYLRKPN